MLTEHYLYVKCILDKYRSDIHHKYMEVIFFHLRNLGSRVFLSTSSLTSELIHREIESV